MDRWYCLSPEDRARMIAHEMIEGTRSRYEMEAAKERADREANGPSPMERLRSQYGKR